MYTYNVLFKTEDGNQKQEKVTATNILHAIYEAIKKFAIDYHQIISIC